MPEDFIEIRQHLSYSVHIQTDKQTHSRHRIIPFIVLDNDKYIGCACSSVLAGAAYTVVGKQI